MKALTGVEIIKSIIAGNKDFKGWDLSNLDLDGVKFFKTSNLEGVNLMDSKIDEANNGEHTLKE